LNKGQCCANCAASLIFVRLRVAEIGENPIAHVLRQEAIKPSDDVSAGVLERRNNASVILRVKAVRQLG
jgi:hypothetical protein